MEGGPPGLNTLIAAERRRRGGEYLYLTAGPDPQLLDHLISGQYSNDERRRTMTWQECMRDYEMKVLCRQLSRRCNDRWLFQSRMKEVHRKQWAKVMDQMEEIALRPSDPESDIPLLQKGGALYLELIAAYSSS